MTAIILAGGKGTRLEPFTVAIPKPLMPVGDLPILEIVIRQLQAAGVTRIVLALGHMSYFFLPFIERWRAEGVSIECCYEEEPLGTAGPIRLVKNLEENFLLMNGDLLTTLDFAGLLEAHRERDAWCTIAVAQRELKVDYGVITPNAHGLLDTYTEKPVITYDVSMGINVLSRRCLSLLPPHGKFDVPDLMGAVKKAGKPVLCHKPDCYWKDIGRLEDLQQATADFIRTPERFLREWRRPA